MKRLLLTLTAVAGLATALPAAAQFQKPEDAVKYRESAMTVMANHFGRIGAMVNGRVPYDAGQAMSNAEIVAVMSKLPFAGFIDGTPGTKKGSASPKIWSDRAGFDGKAKKMQDEVAKLVVAARANNLDPLKAAFGEVGKACKSCHDDFRNP
ncbi:MAG: cytochrome c [Rubrivivax sp.]|jgi:cytochrome c556|nr:cytochrome c [Rubrivivax sp.]MBK7263243.1 cytochrome c [Rubrivivax sp.]MBK8529330.1 cytochrome c [Rubrivivax sp.]